MKYFFSFMLCIILMLRVQAQPAAAIEYNLHTAGISIGYLVDDRLELTTGFNTKLFSYNTILYASAGYKILFSHKDDDNFNLTPSIGIGKYFLQLYDAKDQLLEDSKNNKLFLRLEAGKDWYMGRLFISANYCAVWYCSVGIKAFIQ
ncbi:MAG: hypothetical protein H7320_13780 [Ferruginibacter sp.]|nr:hypothetical protein [Ferruginibacter sp.]